MTDAGPPGEFTQRKLEALRFAQDFKRGFDDSAGGLASEGKYAATGRRVTPLRVALPFQTVGAVNELAAGPSTQFGGRAALFADAWTTTFCSVMHTICVEMLEA